MDYSIRQPLKGLHGKASSNIISQQCIDDCAYQSVVQQHASKVVDDLAEGCLWSSMLQSDTVHSLSLPVVVGVVLIPRFNLAYVVEELLLVHTKLMSQSSGARKMS